jgi:hypothetical protein
MWIGAGPADLAVGADQDLVELGAAPVCVPIAESAWDSVCWTGQAVIRSDTCGRGPRCRCRLAPVRSSVLTRVVVP